MALNTDRLRLNRLPINQFRGAIAGAILGLMWKPSPLGWYGQFPPDRQSADGQSNPGEPGAGLPLPISQPSSPGQAIRTVVLDLTQRLIEGQDVSPVVTAATSSLAAEAEVALALLPIYLFYHDDPVQLRDRLYRLVGAIASPACLETVLLTGLTFCHLLDRAVDLSQVMPQVIAQLGPEGGASEPEPVTLAQQLRQIQTWLATPPGLAEIWAGGLPQADSGAAPSWPVVLALYCFLCTPDDFSLSLQRSRQAVGAALRNETVAIAPFQGLVGALVGAYLGEGGLPLDGQLALAAAGDSGPDVLLRATHLFAAWAGVHRPQTLSSAPFLGQIGTVAATP